MSFKSFGCALFLLTITAIGFTPLIAQLPTDFKNVSQLNMYLDAAQKNPNSFSAQDLKKITSLAMAAARNNSTEIKRVGLWLLGVAIRQNAHFNQFPQTMALVRGTIKHPEVAIRGLSIQVLREIVTRYTKIDEIKEDALHVVHTGIKSHDVREKCDAFDLYCSLIDRDKAFNQFDHLVHDIDLAMQSNNENIQASGIWLLAKDVKRNPRFNDFKKANTIAEKGMTSSHEGIRCHTLALLGELIQKGSHCSELSKIRKFAITEVHGAMAAAATKKDELVDAFFTNSLALISSLMDYGAAFENDEYVTIEQAALRGIKLKAAKAWANGLNVLVRLIEKHIVSTSVDQLTTIALQAMESKMPRVLSSGLRLLRTILQKDAPFAEFEAAEQAALRCAAHDNTWVRRYALDLLIALLEKDKLKNLTAAEHLAERSTLSANDEEYRTGKHLRNAIVRKKQNKTFMLWLVVLASLGLCYFMGSWLLCWLRNRRLRW